MNLAYQRVQFQRIWTTLPNISGLPAKTLPPRPILIEAFKAEYSEEELRQRILLTTDPMGYGVVNAAAINALPTNYVTHLYNNMRYRRPTPDGIFPLRSETAFSTSPHAIPGLIMMSRIFLSLYRDKATRIEPDIRAEADRLLRLLVTIDYTLWTILGVNPTGVKGNNLIFSAQIVTTTAVGSTEENPVFEEVYVVFMDEERLQEYEAAGMTAEEAAQWWFDNKTQPPLP